MLRVITRETRILDFSSHGLLTLLGFQQICSKFCGSIQSAGLGYDRQYPEVLLQVQLRGHAANPDYEGKIYTVEVDFCTPQP